MIPKIETCEDCGWMYKEGTSDYDSIFQTGYCGDCLVERVERGEELLDDQERLHQVQEAIGGWLNEK